MNLPLEETIEKGAALPHLSKRSVLDLAPLELDCMNTLWPIGEGTVREIRDGLAPRRARAYTTIMTIMDRLARKGVVERRKKGRAYVYRPRLTEEDARAQALVQVIEGFFGGSKDALLAHLANGAGARRAAAAAVGAVGASLASDVQAGETFAREHLDITRV
ncbi:MAG TPA: BlaI/MecI/CopY family transcriptional regulator [Candidatus Acidoferrales bacterium]|jgi:predicted transcriptional regulator|nr:BlaI/MecI/CopY family transcriptional regulator [Candidatus Acidoferrales bacterium]